MTQELLIAGGGIGGLAAALALARKGFAVRVCERASEFGEIGYGIQLGPNALKVLDHLGLKLGEGGALEQHVFRPNAVVMLDALSGHELTRFDAGLFPAKFGYPYVVIHRRDLHGALLDACRANSLVALETSKELTGFTQSTSGVRVQFADGTNRDARALIGADGLRSVARAQIINDGAPRMSGHVARRGVVPIDDIEDRTWVDSVIIWCGPNLHFVQYRLRGGTVMNNVAVIESPKFLRGETGGVPGADWGGMDEFHQVFERAVPQVQSMLKFINLERNWPMQDRDPTSGWTQGNVTLLGDAAHPTLQYLAQGACMAMEDAVVLAQELSRDGAPSEAVFRRYEAQRYLRAARITLTSRFFGHVCHADGGARDLRNALCAGRAAGQTSEVDWLYRGIGV